MWMSPDPAGQFANPYTYGGDPLNFIDPTGLWNLGMGLVFGWVNSHGWSGGVCVGEAGTCLGIESGGSMYWDSEGNYMGATVFTDVYVSVAGGLGKITALGYEQGFGMEGRGFYTGVSGLGIHAEATQKQGYSYGFQEKAYFGVGDNFGKISANGKQKDVGMEFWIPSLGKYGRYGIGDTYDVSHVGMANALREGLINLNIDELNDYIKELKLFELDDSGKMRNPSKDEYNHIKNLLRRAEGVTLKEHVPFDCSFTYDKDQIVVDGVNGYPQLEFKYSQNENTGVFSSYNYGTNVFKHLLIDFVGYYLSPNPK